MPSGRATPEVTARAPASVPERTDRDARLSGLERFDGLAEHADLLGKRLRGQAAALPRNPDTAAEALEMRHARRGKAI